MQSGGDVNTLMSWIGVDTSAESTDGGGVGGANPPDMNSMPALQAILQSNGDVNSLMSFLGHDIENEAHESETESN
jgi:hypothetical protein